MHEPQLMKFRFSDDASNWNTIYNETSGNGEIDDITLNGSGRYLRVLCNQRNTEWGFSLFELEVYGNSPTAINTIKDETILLYPNPAKNSVTIEDVNHVLKEINIFNSAGQAVQKVKIHSSVQVIPLNDLPVGMYFVKCSGPKKSIIKTLFITD